MKIIATGITMIIILFLFISLLFHACKENNKCNNIITSKSPTNTFGSYLPIGLCTFYYNNGEYFIDSCKYYYVMDTVGKTKIRK